MPGPMQTLPGRQCHSLSNRHFFNLCLFWAALRDSGIYLSSVFKNPREGLWQLFELAATSIIPMAYSDLLSLGWEIGRDGKGRYARWNGSMFEERSRSILEKAYRIIEYAWNFFFLNLIITQCCCCLFVCLGKHHWLFAVVVAFLSKAKTKSNNK